MLAHMERVGDGLRRYDAAAALADATAQRFQGLPPSLRHGHVLAAFKQASQYLGYPIRVVHLIDALFAWTSAEDWTAGQTPIVWPRNELLSHKLGVGIRQTQKLLDLAVALQLVTHIDSPNGHRGGQRDDQGRIKWAYGIVLSPLGERYDEFVSVTARGRKEDAQLKALHRRLAAARRKTRSIVQATADQDIDLPNASVALELARMATSQMRGSRNRELLQTCVEQIERATTQLATSFAAAIQHNVMPVGGVGAVDNSPSHDVQVIHSTTTTELKSAFAEYGSGLAEERSRSGSGPASGSQTEVEKDLEQHKVDPGFIRDVCADACVGLKQSHADWGDVIQIAERLVDLNSIHRKAWTEACVLMGDRGAAAAVIVTIQKFRSGVVRRPGAYLRGLSGRAASGSLHLGRSFHGLKDLTQTSQMMPSPIGARAIDDAVGPLVASLLARHGGGRLGQRHR